MLILASASPRRRELLTQAGFSFQVESIPVNEDPRPHEDPIHLVKRLAREKAEAVFNAQPKTPASARRSAARPRCRHGRRLRSRNPQQARRRRGCRPHVAPARRSHPSGHHRRLPHLAARCRSRRRNHSRHHAHTCPTKKSSPTSPLGSRWTRPAPTPSRATPAAGFPASSAATSTWSACPSHWSIP